MLPNRQCHSTLTPLDDYLTSRAKLLRRFFSPAHLLNRSFLDLGANAGFFSLWAARNGAQVTSVDMDAQYLELLRSLASFRESPIRIQQSSAENVTEPADVVNALALVHWLFSCTASFGTLERVVDFLAGLTREMLFIEWIDPADAAIQRFGHTSYDSAAVEGAYTREVFLNALRARFPKLYRLGQSKPNRELFVAVIRKRVSQLYIDLPGERVSKRAVYFRDKGMLTRESFWLSRLEASGFTPRLQHTVGDAQPILNSHVLHADRHGIRTPPAGAFDSGFVGQNELPRDEIAMDYVGEPVSRETLPPDWQLQADHILAVLKQYGCCHNDIKPEDILVRDGRLFLIDFGWATKLGDAIPPDWPQTIGEQYRLGIHHFDDRHAFYSSIGDVMR